jgi:hypothetical protein
MLEIAGEKKEKVMRKLLVLFMVLGMASLAHAALSFDTTAISLAPGATSALITVQSDGSDGETILTAIDYYYGAGSPTPAGGAWDGGISFGSAAVLDDAGDDASIIAYTPSTSYPGIRWEAKDASEPFNIAAGDWMEFKITASTTATPGRKYEVEADYFDTLGTSGTLIVTIIPEPLTMALLGVGGLALLRRRR